jgi:hypothetical protein
MGAKLMTPGIYDIPPEVYHNSEGISRSGIMELKKSPLHYWHKYINKHTREPQTNSLQLGNLLHTYILEPHEFEKRYFIAEKISKQTNAGKEKWKEYEAQAQDRQIIFKDTLREVEALTAALDADAQAKELVRSGKNEQSIYWIDDDTGVLCKCRPDILHENMVVDLKSSSDGTWNSFQRDVRKYGYYIQAAMIRDGVKKILNKDINEFIYVVLEVNQPYPIGIYFLNQASLDKGQEEYKKELAKYKHCLENDAWPSYEPMEVTLPNYFL